MGPSLSGTPSSPTDPARHGPASLEPLFADGSEGDHFELADQQLSFTVKNEYFDQIRSTSQRIALIHGVRVQDQSSLESAEEVIRSFAKFGTIDRVPVTLGLHTTTSTPIPKHWGFEPLFRTDGAVRPIGSNHTNSSQQFLLLRSSHYSNEPTGPIRLIEDADQLEFRSLATISNRHKALDIHLFDKNVLRMSKTRMLGAEIFKERLPYIENRRPADSAQQQSFSASDWARIGAAVNNAEERLGRPLTIADRQRLRLRLGREPTVREAVDYIDALK